MDNVYTFTTKEDAEYSANLINSAYRSMLFASSVTENYCDCTENLEKGVFEIIKDDFTQSILG